MLSEEQGRELDPLARLEGKRSRLPALPGPSAGNRSGGEHRARTLWHSADGRGLGRDLSPHQRSIDHLGIRHLFQAVVTSEDVTRQKPAPDIFLEAARRLGVAPEFCRAYEDTDLGLQAIRAAGMEAVDVRPLRKLDDA